MAQVVFSPGYNAYVLYAPGYVRIEPNASAINQYFLYSGQPSVNVNNVPTCPDQNINLFLLDAAGIPTATFNTMVAGKTWTAAGGVY